MEQHELLITLAIAVSAIAMLFQAGLLFGMYKSSRAVQENLSRLLPKVEALVESSRTAIEDSHSSIVEITTKTNEILDVTRKQLARVDSVLEDAAARARVQMDRAEMVVDDAMGRAQETVALVHSGIMKPIREINGVAIGLRTAIRFFMRGERTQPDQVTADEEMFI